MSSVLKQSSHVVYKTQLRERRTRHAAMLAATKPHCKKPIKFKINMARDRPTTGCLLIPAVCTLRYYAPVFFSNPSFPFFHKTFLCKSCSYCETSTKLDSKFELNVSDAPGGKTPYWARYKTEQPPKWNDRKSILSHYK